MTQQGERLQRFRAIAVLATLIVGLGMLLTNEKGPSPGSPGWALFVTPNYWVAPTPCRDALRANAVRCGESADAQGPATPT